jgi:6-phosphogluconolactonase (cycloisomerase 2 family)
MKTLLFAAASVTAACLFGVAGNAFAAGAGGVDARAASLSGAVFVQTNELTGNSIVSYARSADGVLTPAGRFATGGKGGAALGAVSDRLASQGSLVYDAAHRLLLAVNAGSNSLSVFRVDGTQLTLRQVIWSGGDFPASVAVHGDLVYVLNAGGVGRLSGYRVSNGALTPIADGIRSLGLANTNPPFFLTSPGQVGFSPDGQHLIVTTKASGSHIDVFAVSTEGRLSSQPVVNNSATPVPFAFTFTPQGRLAVGEAGASSLTTYILHPNGTLTDPLAQTDGQAALCWIVKAGDYYYVANTGSSTLSSFRISANGQPGLLNPVAATTETGSIDVAVSPDNRFLYAEAGAAGTLDEFQINPDGSLTKIGVIDAGLPPGLEGIATT